MKEGTQRRLAAIVSADVVGYSRLIGADEAGTLAALRAHRNELIDPLISQHNGRIVKTMGDGLLLEFPSVVDAVNCSIVLQSGMAERNQGAREDKCITFRIGINLGDIVIEGEDIFGDGVNVAARIQEASPPGGLTISGVAHESLGTLIDIDFEDAGQQQFKNIARSIQVWRWSPKETAISSVVTEIPIALPDKPSIAVLPFDNMSGDPEQEFFSDGMTEDIITGLSRFHSLFVTARTSTFTFKGQALDIKQVGAALGVRYILEGSVRRGGSRARITAQLIAAASGGHIWAERYDREIVDIFAVQDEVTDAIIAAIAPEIDHTERERARRNPPNNLDAWSLYQRALTDYYLSDNPGLKSAMKVFDRVTEIDPSFAPAWAMAAEARARYVLHGQPKNRNSVLREAREKAQAAMNLDSRDPLCIFADGRVHVFSGDHDLGIAKLKDALSLNPNNAQAHYALGHALVVAGRTEESIPAIDHAIRLSPRDAFLAGFLNTRAWAFFHLCRYEEAAESARLSIHSSNARYWAYAFYAMSLFRLDKIEAAKIALDDVYSHIPNFSVELVRKAFGHHDEDSIRIMTDVLYELGVPD